MVQKVDNKNVSSKGKQCNIQPVLYIQLYILYNKFLLT
jgi:hypothetical protein